MNIELMAFDNGNVVLACQDPLPNVVQRAEYYRDQKLLMLVYGDQDDQLMEYELNDDLNAHLVSSPNIFVFSAFDAHDPTGYKVPLVQINED